MSDDIATLLRADSLPALEAVPSPTHAAAASAASTNGSIEASIASSSVPTLHNELPRAFSGEILHTLENLGVSAYSTAEVEQTVIARAMQVEEEANARKQAKQAALHGGRKQPADMTDSQSRKRIPKKIGTSIAAASLPPSALAPAMRVVHEDDPVTAAGTLSKQRLEDALAIRQQRDKPRSTLPTPGRGERKEQQEGVDDSKPSVRTAKERMVDQGELTPFHSMPGVEKGFTRVSRTELPTRAPAASATARPRAAAPPPVRTSLPSKSSSSRKSSATRTKAPPRSSTPTLRPPPASRGRHGSVTPPPGLRESKSPVSSDSSVASAWSVDELPKRLTRARMRQEERSVEEALQRSSREASGVKEEAKEEERRRAAHRSRQCEGGGRGTRQ